MQFSRREEWLLCAALSPEGPIAASSWNEWASEIKLEDAPYPEFRLLPAVYANLNRVAPSLALPDKLRGVATYTFTKNHLLIHGCMPIIEELSKHSIVLLTKGIGICIRFGAWSSRTTRDVDIHVTLQSLDKVCEVLAQSGWTPKHGMTRASLVHRSSLRRDSWNFTKGDLDLDIHWRVKSGCCDNLLAKEMWASADQTKFLGRTLLLQSPELALITSLNHGFIVGDHADVLQTIVDAAWLLPICQGNVLVPLLNKSDLLVQFRILISILQKIGPSETVSHYRCLLGNAHIADSTTNPVLRHKTEMGILRQPVRYWLWDLLGRKSRLERLIIRFAGPFSKPLAQPETFKNDYDLRDCEQMDQIGGPGWGWPEPDNTCFWSDQADARFLIPLRHVGDYLIVLGLADCFSPNACVDVFANGVYLSSINLRERLSTSEYCLLVSRRFLFGSWVELSLRPKPYLGDQASANKYWLKRSVPVQRLRVFDIEQMNEGGFEISPLDIVRQVTTVSELPALPQSPSGPDRWEFMEGLNTQMLIEPAVVPGQRALRLVAVGADGRHALEARFGTLAPGGVYRVITWVKAQPRVRVMIEVRDTFDPHTGNASNYGVAQFDLGARTIAKSSGDILASGIDAATDGWVKLWADLRSKDGQLHVLLGLLESPNNSHVFMAAGSP